MSQRFVLPRFGIDAQQGSMAGVEHVELIFIKPGEWGMESPRTTASPLGTWIKQPPLALLSLQPRSVSVSPRAVTKAGALPSSLRAVVEMAAITGGPTTDEGRSHWGTAPVALDCHQPIKEGVHQPEAAIAPGQVMAHHRSTSVAGAC